MNATSVIRPKQLGIIVSYFVYRYMQIAVPLRGMRSYAALRNANKKRDVSCQPSSNTRPFLEFLKTYCYYYKVRFRWAEDGKCFPLFF